jgi:hypothetical protein
MTLSSLSNHSRLLIFLGALIGGSCVHELPVPVDTGGTPSGGGNTGGGTIQLPTCSQDTVYFNNTVLPIINSTCGKTGCHGSVSPGAFTMTTYSKIVNRVGTINRLNNALQDMADVKKDKPYLDYTPPTPDQLALLQKWINQGAKNNTCNACDTTKFTFAAIVQPIMGTYCVGCHKGTSASAGVDLSTIAAIQAEIKNNPGRLLGSIQWTSPYTGAKQMPQGSGKLPDCYITQIKKWINAGALNN